MTSTNAFELVREARIDELNTLARLYRHGATGAELLSLENDDENKCFAIAFRTPPPDSTGLPHILEHSVLSGSEKYPAKDPFIELAKSSLNTFLNAFTSPDNTVYALASTNVQDLYNLIDVYMDAVLHPLLREHTFEQEAWHYELHSIDGPLSIKGVVYNEMRGEYSSPDSLLMRLGRQVLFPSTPYSQDAGGDPEQIPTLTYDQFLAFHRTYYHPSNARIFFYGDDDPQERLRRMADYLQGYERRDVDSHIPLQPSIAETQRLTARYPVSPEEDASQRGHVTVGWLLPEVTDPILAMSMSMLEYILISTPGSPLRKALLDSGLGEDLAGTGLDKSLRQMVFSTGLKGIRVDDAPRVEQLIHDTLARLAEDGLDPELVEAALNTTEFSLRENNTGRFPRGLSLAIRGLRTWLYDADPVTSIAFEGPLTAVKDRVSGQSRYFERLIESHLLQNAHRAVVVMEPDPELSARQEQDLQQRLAAVRASLTPEQLQDLVARTHLLERLQETPDPPEVLAKIPALRLEDLQPTVPTIPLDQQEIAGTQVLYHDLFTNGILYLDLAMDLHVVPQELIQLVPLFARALTDMGTDDEDYVQLSQRIGRKTGGIGHSMLIGTRLEGGASEARLVLRGKATIEQTPDLLDILRDILLKVNLDNRDRFLQMVLEDKAGSEASLIPAGHGVANSRLRASFGEADWLGEQLGGVSYLFFLRRLEQRVRHDWPAVLSDLQRLRGLLINRAAMVCNATVDCEAWQGLQPEVGAHLADLPRATPSPTLWERHQAPRDEALTVPSQVNYVAKGANLYGFGYAHHGSVAVITHYLRSTWLWERIRVQGGAYGAFCVFDYRSGIWSYVSYRDPNLLRTIEVYDRTPDFLRTVNLSRDDLTRNIIGTIGSMDAYMLPDAKGFTSMARHLLGDTDAERQRRRDEILSTSVDDFRRFADALEAVRTEGRVVVLGSPEAIRAANAERDNWLTVTRVL